MRKEVDWISRIGRRLRLRDMHILLTVAKAGSIGKAAVALGVSQPVASKAVSDLERALGVRLLDRSPRGVELTRHGEALLESAITVFDELRQAVKTLEFLSDPTAGELRLGCTEPLAAGFVGAVIEQVTHDFPRVALRVVTADPLSLAERELRQRHIELAVAPLKGLQETPDLDIELLFDDRQVVVAAADSRWTRRRDIALPTLLQQPWVLPPPDTIIGAQVAEAFRAAGAEAPHSQIESFSVPLCLRLVATGRFITMLPLSMVMLARHPPLKLLRLKAPMVARPTGVVVLRDKTPSALAGMFISYARKMTKRLINVS